MTVIMIVTNRFDPDVHALKKNKIQLIKVMTLKFCVGVVKIY